MCRGHPARECVGKKPTSQVYTIQNMVIERQNKELGISIKQVQEAINEFFSQNDYTDKRILLIIPDNTRSGPVGDIFKIIFDSLSDKTKTLDCLEAPGTHPYF